MAVRFLQAAGIVAVVNPIVADPDVGYALDPGFRGRCWRAWVEIDRYGFRNQDRKPADDPVLRVLNLGDSTTFGFAVPAAAHYSSRLQELLEAHHAGPVEVINCGVPGYSVREGVGLISEKSLLQRFRADVVTVYFGWNDLWARPSSTRFSKTPGFRQTVRDLGRHSRLLQASERLRMLGLRWWEAHRLRPGRLAEIDTMLAGAGAGVRVEEFEQEACNVPPNEYVRLLHQLVRRCDETGVSVILIVAPMGPQEMLREFIDAYPSAEPRRFFIHDDYQALTRRVAKESNASLLDLERYFDDDNAALFVDPIHPNEAGHEIIAHQLFSMIAPMTR